MARGTTLTLYKMYNIKMDDVSFNKIVEKYALHNEKKDWSTDKKLKSEYRKDLPCVLNVNAFEKTARYDKKNKIWIDFRKPLTIKNIKDKSFGYVEKDNHFYCEKLMEWDFGSSFDCLVEHFSLGHYSYSRNCMIINRSMASQMLEAIEYILGGEWSDKIERGMNNPYIKIFTEGYCGDSYWKYVYRNKKHNGKRLTIKEHGYEISIKCPNETKDDDFDYAELKESNEAIEYSLNMFRSGLMAFLNSDNWFRNENDDWIDNGSYTYLLTYDFWG